MPTPRYSVHEFVAVVGLHVGEPREVFFDGMQHTRNGVVFVRAAGTSTFISAALITDIDVAKCEPIAGHA